MKRTFVIEVETTNEDLEPEDAASDIATFRDALEDGSLLEAAGRNLPDGTGYPELKHLKARILHEIEKKEEGADEPAGAEEGNDHG